MNLGDLVKIVVKIPGKEIRPHGDIGIIVGLVRRELYGPPDYLVMWSSKEVTISRGYHLEIISYY